MNKPVILDNAGFRREVLESDLPVLVDFTAPWCGPCQSIAPIVGELAVEYDGLVKVGQINTDDNVDIASQFGVTGLPTLMLFDKGEVVGRTGVLSKKGLKDWIEERLDLR